MEYFTLNNGMKIPSVGYGTYKATLEEGPGVIRTAIEAGYRYFDTASLYDNEEAVGQALRESGLAREAFFIASKLWKGDMAPERVHPALELSLRKLGFSYLDLYLIHWPRPDLETPDWEAVDLAVWRELETLCEEGLVRGIGVCNFLPHHLTPLLKQARILPAVNQIEYHPGYLQEETVRLCARHNILVQAWSPIGRARLMEDPLLLELAERYQVSVPQLCIRFALEQGVQPLPKSSARERMAQNLDVFGFSISREDQERIQAMPRTGWSGEHPDRERVYF